ncbi:hypothetical protein BA6E_103164 [Bacteroidales bacterium 6E]|nr:hypothetical protein BA6E_103164 [Bacteroidales bacterium 6E]
MTGSTFSGFAYTEKEETVRRSNLLRKSSQYLPVISNNRQK